MQYSPELRSRSISVGSGSDPSKILRLPAPGQFPKAINETFIVTIFFIKNEKKALHGQNNNLKDTKFVIIHNLKKYAGYEGIFG